MAGFLTDLRFENRSDPVIQTTRPNVLLFAGWDFGLTSDPLGLRTSIHKTDTQRLLEKRLASPLRCYELLTA